tara:strand:- start:489 stop:785 length:297 start_codon:yes stop_codon:yes gene_type:complete
MAASPNIKVFNPDNEYVASCKYFEDAGAVAFGYGPGATVRMGHAKRDTIFTVSDDPDADNDGEYHAAFTAILERRKATRAGWKASAEALKAEREGGAA